MSYIKAAQRPIRSPRQTKVRGAYPKIPASVRCEVCGTKVWERGVYLESVPGMKSTVYDPEANAYIMTGLCEVHWAEAQAAGGFDR